jgi:hypothetical protein
VLLSVVARGSVDSSTTITEQPDDLAEFSDSTEPHLSPGRQSFFAVNRVIILDSHRPSCGTCHPQHYFVVS